MIEMFGPEDVEMAEDGLDQGESQSAKSCKSVLTNRSSGRDPTPTKIKFLQEYPALMDPMNFLSLLVRFPPGDIVTWANAERSVSLFSSTQLSHLRGNVIDLMSEITPGGLPMLQQCMDIAKDHHRLGLPQQKWNTNGPALRVKSIDEWYWRVSETTTTDSVQLPFSYGYTTTQREVLKWSLRGYDQMLLSTLLRGLLRDPLIPHLSLQEIPDDALIDMCTRYSYLHIADALKFNRPNMQLTTNDIKTRVEDLVFASRRWVPTSDVASSSSSENEVQQRCGPCVDNGITTCMAGRAIRKPGQHCSSCTKFGWTCKDRSVNDRSAFLMPHIYTKQQKACGHLNETWREGHGPEMQKAQELRQELYALLHRCRSPAIGARLLRLPRNTLEEGKLPSLIKDIWNPAPVIKRELGQFSSIQAQVLCKKVDDDDGDVPMEDLKTLVVNVLNGLEQ